MSFVLLLFGLGPVLNDMLWSSTYFCAKFNMSCEPLLEGEAIEFSCAKMKFSSLYFSKSELRKHILFINKAEQTKG